LRVVHHIATVPPSACLDLERFLGGGATAVAVGSQGSVARCRNGDGEGRLTLLRLREAESEKAASI
jgi:hypothetical protein